MSAMFGDISDEEVELKTNNEYAKNYDKWRQKEVFNQLKTKYGNIDDERSSDESSSEDDDDEDIEISEQMEKDFYKTLSKLRNKDPEIYDSSVKFFDDTPIETSVKKKQSTQKPVFIKDYERQMLLENRSLSDDENDQEEPPKSPTYVQEQDNLRKNLKSALENIDEEDSEWGGMFKTRQKTKAEIEKEEAVYKQWLKGQTDHLDSKEEENNLKPLKEYWNDPNLDEGEKFLRDYVLNNKFLETEDKNRVPTYDEVVHDDEPISDDEIRVDEQEEFETKYNFRFEEEDPEFIKRYPRVIESSVRKTDDRRKVKRQEIKERKIQEKEEKMKAIQKLREIKRKEIEEKLKTLREITGNSEVAFEDQDIDGDFDPSEHDKRMHALFNDQFYQGEEGDQKPEFSDMDDELEIERWDKKADEIINAKEDGPHCEDDDFNMDCDYDPSVSTQDELIDNSKRKKKKRKSKFAQAVSKPKPAFDPNEKTYDEYLDEYYQLDCEDIIGDIPCRFKYREVIPNSFGLTIDEILKANDKELNRWCSIKKAMQHRPDHIERYDQIAFGKKALNEDLKRKLLPSLYAEENNPVNENQDDQVDADQGNQSVKRNGKNKVVKHDSHKEPVASTSKDSNSTIEIKEENSEETDSKLDIKIQKEEDQVIKKEKSGRNRVKNVKIQDKIDETLEENKIVHSKSQEESPNNSQSPKKAKKKKKKNKKKKTVAQEENGKKTEPKSKIGKQNGPSTSKNPAVDNSTKHQNSRKRKNSNHQQHENATKKGKKTDLSDARLQAFGINPKKFKNKLKYGNN